MASRPRSRWNSDPIDYHGAGVVGDNYQAGHAPGGYRVRDVSMDVDPIGEEEPTVNKNTVTLRWMRTENNRFLKRVSYLLGILAIYSSVMAPLKCAFKVEDFLSWFLLPIEFAFSLDILREWICVIIDDETMVFDRYVIFRIIIRNPRKLESLACFPQVFLPWEYALWLKVFRALTVKELFHKLEKDLMNYDFIIRVVKLIYIQLYAVHVTGCMFYHLAATTSEGLTTWIASASVGDKNLTQLDTLANYIASIYFATVTVSTVGYGDIHAVNLKEMGVVACLIILSLIVWTYLGVNWTSLMVRRSRGQIVREKMENLENYLANTKVSEDLRRQIREHMEIKYNDEYNNKIIEDFPASIRAKMSQNFNESILRRMSLFRGCSPEFMNHLASEVREEFYAPGYTVLEEGTVVNQICILISGDLEQLHRGVELPEHIRPARIFGLDSLVLQARLVNTFRACKTSKILLIRKHFFMEALETHLQDASRVMTTLESGRDQEFVKALRDSEFGLRMQKDEMMKASLLNHAVHSGDLYKVKTLVRSGAVKVDSVDYSNISPLHVAATRGFTVIAKFLIDQGANVNARDLNGTTPLLEAIKNGRDGVAEALALAGAHLGIDDVGENLCKMVSEQNLFFLRRLRKYNIDPNARNYAGQTALHIAVAKLSYSAAEELLSAGADRNLKDSWGHTPMDEANRRHSYRLANMLRE